MARAGIHVSLAAIISLLLLGCSTPVSIGYAPAADSNITKNFNPSVRVAAFDDVRKNKGSDQIGSIRGGYGNPIYVLTVDQPVPQIVRDSFTHGLAARGLLADRNDAQFILAGQVIRLDCNQYMRPEAHADFVVTLTDIKTGKVVATTPIKRDAVEGFTFAVGVFGSSDELKALTNKVLQQAVDDSLDSPAFAPYFSLSKL